MRGNSVAATHDGTARVATRVGLLVALLAVSAQIMVPLGPVPATLQVLVVVLCAQLLRPSAAAAAMGCYLLLGAAGVPVFAQWAGGLGVILGPTGGYLVGFAAGAWAGALMRTALRDRGAAHAFGDVVAAVVCIATIYILGVPWLAYSTGMGLWAAVAAGALPFLAIDAAKAAAATVLASALRRTGLGD